MAIVCLYIRPRVLEQEWHCREAYEEATFTFILLVEDVLKSYRWNEFLLVATSIHSVLCDDGAPLLASAKCGLCCSFSRVGILKINNPEE